MMAFVVIFVAEWGDPTQSLTANLAPDYHSPLEVATVERWPCGRSRRSPSPAAGGWAESSTGFVIRLGTAVLLAGLAVNMAWAALS